ncbi:MAG: hypothetical protein HFI73_05225 [Bacilli bacterium]|nr:hypothetical protein [Bacilli bacterium]
MSKKGIIQNALIIVLGLAIISMSIGYAAYDKGTVIKGNSQSFEKANWDVHLEQPVRTVNSTILDENIIKAPVVNKSGTEVSFSLNMTPGSVYEFTVDVNNAGTFDSMLSNYEFTAYQEGIPVIFLEPKELSDSYITYEVIDFLENEILNKGEISTKRVRVLASDKVLENNTNFNYDFKLNVTYVQKN